MAEKLLIMKNHKIHYWRDRVQLTLHVQLVHSVQHAVLNMLIQCRYLSFSKFDSEYDYNSYFWIKNL